ncbi:CBS domain-containing protein [archaeon]|nr:CBS domain-containing protein [archaeon]
MNIKNIKLSEVISNPITVGPNTTLVKAREIILKNKVKRVIVVDKTKPVGVITEKDIAKKIYELGTTPIKSVKAVDFKPKTLFTLTRDNTVQECAKLMKRHRINSIIILNKNEALDGIVTKTNLISSFLTCKIISVKVSKLMKRQLITVTPSDPILYAESLLIKYGLSRIIVKQNQIPTGMITFRDFVPAKIPQWIAESADPKDVQEYKFKEGLKENHSNQLSYLFPFHATDIMSTNPITVEMDEDVGVAITRMIKYDIGGLPVVKNSKLVGIITKSDIVNELVD